MVENSMFYPLGTVGEFEPFVNFSLNFLKFLEFWYFFTIFPHLKAGPSGHIYECLMSMDHCVMAPPSTVVKFL